MQLTPQEIEVWYVLPAIRRELAKAMLEKGLKQREIAEIMEVTAPAISQYLKSKRAKEARFSNNLLKEIRKAAERITKDKYLLMPEIQNICSIARKEEILCGLHRKLCKSFHEKCRK